MGFIRLGDVEINEALKTVARYDVRAFPERCYEQLIDIYKKHRLVRCDAASKDQGPANRKTHKGRGMNMDKIRLVIIGMGRISPNHVMAAKNNAETFELAAVCDLSDENIDKALAKADYTAPVARYSDYKVMLAEVRPDMAAIATESGLHAEIGLYCLEQGCHVLIEKPMAMSVRDAQRLIDKAEEKGVCLGACHQNRFNKSVQQIRAALDEGRFGNLSHIAAHVRWNRNRDYYAQAPWRGKWASDGGCLMNQCIHNADLMYWMLGDIDEVFAYTAQQQHDYLEAEDLGLALVKGKNGAYGLFEGTVNVYPKNLEETLYLFGESGTVKAAGTSVNLIEEWRFADGKDDPEAVKRDCNEQPPNIYGFGHTRLYADFAEAVRTGRKPLVDGEAGKRALELILAMYQSQKTGLPVKLPLEDFASTDMAGTFGEGSL